DAPAASARPAAWLALNGSQRASPDPTSCPAMPSTSAIQASAAAMATARLRTSAPMPTPIAANAMLTATPPPSVRQESAAGNWHPAAWAHPPRGVAARGARGGDRPRRGADGRVHGQLGGHHPAAAGAAEEGIGHRAVPVLSGHGEDAEDEREERGQGDVRERL